MIQSKAPRIAQDVKSRDDEYPDTLKPEIPALDDLFKKLALEQHPDFLSVMAAISEMVAFYTDHDKISKGPHCDC